MILSQKTLPAIKKTEGLSVPGADIFSLPEKVLQFGTGVLLRGLPDYFIDKANKQGIFNGRIVVVKSTSQGGTDVFAQQDNLYTQCVRGIENGKRVDEAIINASVSRVLTASAQWATILECAANPELQLIVSNTTEVGIALHNHDNVYAAPPASFPGKLLAFLLARYKAFNDSAESGMVIIPTELITRNGDTLRNIVIELARQNKLDDAFIAWITTANDFCNSLVDRIVPGILPGNDKAATETRLGFKDDLMIMSEAYRLWAIETSRQRTKQILSFSSAGKGVVISENIDQFRELKLRLLNGSHTFTCALAVQMGFTTVKQAMENEVFSSFISRLMLEEIVPAIVSENLTREAGRQFSADVLERYKNPFIEHQWLSIALQYTSKMKMRNIPVLLQYYQKMGAVPPCMVLGFAAYLLFMKSEHKENKFTGRAHGETYTINDDKAAELYHLWRDGNTDNFVTRVLQDTSLWGASLAALPGLKEALTEALALIQQAGIVQAVQTFPSRQASQKNQTA